MAFPVLVASTASLDELNTRLQAKGEAAVDMRRFRANVVLGNSELPHAQEVMPHDEDRIGVLTIHTQAHGQSQSAQSNQAVQLKPVKPCPRCPSPTSTPIQRSHILPSTMRCRPIGRTHASRVH